MDPLSLRPSIPVDSSTLHHVSDLLAVIEDLEGNPTGVLNLAPFGQIYLEKGRICWVMYPGQQQRLGQLLRYQRNPPIDPALLTQIVKECQESNTPLGEALLESGEISEEGLRAALLSHSAESMARIANSPWKVEGFDSDTKYEARFLFTTVDLMTHLGAAKHLTLSAVAKKNLAAALVGGGSGLAFIRQVSVNHPILIAVSGSFSASVSQACELCSWTSSLFDLSRTVDPDVHAASGSWRGNQAVVTWQQGEVSYTALFTSRAASALALSSITRHSVSKKESTP